VTSPLLDVADLSVQFETDDGVTHAVDRLSFTLAASEVLGIVGESGCGKSVTMLSLLRLLPETATVTGRALFDGRDLLSAPVGRLRQIRGREISFVFQEPMTSLNPSFTVGKQIASPPSGAVPKPGEGTRHRAPRPRAHPGFVTPHR
jgi:peptide/nickel transport system ATP-binding protein